MTTGTRHDVSIYEAAGGAAAFLRLAAAHHRRRIVVSHAIWSAEQGAVSK